MNVVLTTYIYPHMCRDGHPQIGHSISDDDERCPLCRALAEVEHLRELDSEARRDRDTWKSIADGNGRLRVALRLIRNSLHAHNRPDTPIKNADRIRLRDIADLALKNGEDALARPEHTGEKS